MIPGKSNTAAPEFVGKYTIANRFDISWDFFETRWQWPVEIGDGFINTIELRPGISLSIGKFKLTEEVAIPYETNFSPVIFSYCLQGRIQYSIECEDEQKEMLYTPGNSFISHIPQHRCVAKPLVGSAILIIGIYIDASLLASLLECDGNCLPCGMGHVVSGTDQKYFCHAAAISPTMNTIIHQILHCPYQSSLQRLYLESKALELISVNLAQSIPNETTGHNCCCIMRPQDRERINLARKLIESDIQNPPRLLDLARTVGLPHPKLNCFFREVYGTTIFGYLRDIRLNRAKMLLHDGAMNVSEVAYEVGYSSLSHFAKAFKCQFGDAPGNYLRKISGRPPQ